MRDALRDALAGAGVAEIERNIWSALRCAADLLAEALGLPGAALLEARLGGAGGAADLGEELHAAVASHLEGALARGLDPEVSPGAAAEARLDNRRSAHLLGELLNDLLAIQMQLEGAAPGRPSTRRRSGSFFTPRAVCAAVAKEALAPLLETRATGVDALRICDPAVGGGAFLIEICVLLEEHYVEQGLPPEQARRRAVAGVYGVDRSELAVAVAEVALWLYLADPEESPRLLRGNLVHGDALCGDCWRPELHGPPPDGPVLHWHAAFPEVARTGFDLVIGNPPWVAFAGRSAQPLTAEWRAYFRGRFAAFVGFPTLHGLFVQRAAELAPRGRIALLLPSAVADLDGYRGAREVLGRTHDIDAPLTELGQDVFEGVVQPTFVLVADGRRAGDREDVGARGEAWPLRERSRSAIELTFAPAPPALERVGGGAPLPPETFRELGFQSNREVTSRLFLRDTEAKGPFLLPLLEGRTVKEFRVERARLFLWGDEAELKAAGARLRSAAEYRGVDFVVRQTAAVTIAARHTGMAFRNSLLAGYGVGALDADLLVGLLNSSLFRALHLSRQRDARQAAFPQVKLGHLRRLPTPPEQAELRERVRRVSIDATARGACAPSLRAELDTAVARLFGLEDAELVAVERFLDERVGKKSSASRANPEIESRTEA